MSEANNGVRVGSTVAVKVGKNEITATVLEILADGYRVQSTASQREFAVKKIVRAVTTSLPEDPVNEADQPLEPEAEDEAEAPNPAPESGKPEIPAKRMSLMDAAVEVLKTSEQPLNTREIVSAATEAGLWIPTACKTPEQTLYGAIFREIATKDQPRIVKSEQKGKFRLA